MSPPGFTGAALDRADHLRLDPDRVAALARAAEARMLKLDGLVPAIDEDGRVERVAVDIRGELVFLGIDGEVPLFAPLVNTATAANARELFPVIAALAPQDAALWGVALALNNWHARHPFCSVCGQPSDVFRAGWGRRCGGCGAEHFPRVDPVVIMLAEHEGEVLLGRQPRFPPRRYSALAGFVEPGESIEEAVARELAEEAGIDAFDVRYVASQPWPFPGSLMIACIAEAREKALRIDRTELEDAIWVTRDGVAAALAGAHDAPFVAPPRFAIAHTLLERWLAAG